MCDYINVYTNCSNKVRNFLSVFDSLNISEKLTFLAIIFDRIENGAINSENKSNSFEVSENGYILDNIDCGIMSDSDIAFSLVYAANGQNGGSYPNRDLFDVIDTWIQRTNSLNVTESAFNRLSFRDKLYALAELFCHIGDRQISFNFEKYDIDGYFSAHEILDLAEKLFPAVNKAELPF